MENWLGQDINVGDYVYRGARDGNTSSFKVGEVVSINDEKQVARVHWLYEPGIKWVNRERYDVVRKLDTAGSPTIQSLVKIDPDVVLALSLKT